MDFQKMLQKLDAINPVEKTAVVSEQQTQQPKVVLAEDAQMRVLAGVSSILEEGRKAKEETVKEATKTDKPWTDKSGKAQQGTSVKGKAYGGSAKDTDAEDDEEDAKAADKAAKKGVKESTAAQKAARSKFESMVEAKKKGSKPDFLDMDKDGDKTEPMKKAVADKKGGKPQKGVNPFAKNESVEEGRDEGKPGKNFAKIAKKAGEKYGSKEAGERVAGAVRKKVLAKESKEMVAESVQQKYSFKQCLQMVKESGGQQQIDPVDGALWKWAQRVAVSKVQEGVSADAMAAFVYERMGGEFQLFDVLSETK